MNPLSTALGIPPLTNRKQDCIFNNIDWYFVLTLELFGIGRALVVGPRQSQVQLKPPERTFETAEIGNQSNIRTMTRRMAGPVPREDVMARANLDTILRKQLLKLLQPRVKLLQSRILLIYRQRF